ncbi:MAG: DUF222 domain-containing protein [Candidatus Dormibacteraeota bacterium]|nr:DUF222 domain-containing protein [Candidatus Dormibacteraeota bacterium]
MAAREAGERSGAPLDDQLRDLRHTIDLLEVEFAVLSAEFAKTDKAEHDGYVSPIQWLRHECRTNGHIAATAVTVGQQLDRLPKSAAAIHRREIGFGHLALLASTTQALDESPSSTSWNEDRLLDKAKQHTVSRFRRECIHIRHEADARALLAEQNENARARKLEILPCESGAVAIRGLLDPIGGATLRTALDPLARRNGIGDDRSREQRYADALIELASHGLDAGHVPQRAGVRPHLQVTASLETIQGLRGAPAGDLQLADPIPGESVARIACDASIRRIVIDAKSNVVDVGRAQRIPSGATRHALAARDGGCVWPGCDRPVSWTAAHHLRHWARGGATTLENLALICHRHHWMAHEGGWELVRSDAGEIIALPPPDRYASRARPPGHAA